jgi:hypothetical protein
MIGDNSPVRSIKFERYMNFFREQSDSTYYVLADCPSASYYFYCNS